MTCRPHAAPLRATALLVGVLGVAASWGQIAKDASKFLGNITHQNAVRSDFGTYWNQITAENECKWGVIEGSRDQMNFRGCDAAYDYAKSHGIPFKFHTLVWGSQHPSWLMSLSRNDQLAEITEWMDSVAKHYPDMQMIDVVNEAVTGHAPAPYKDALGGDGTTGHDWVITSFKMARQRWPKAVLILNDYNNLRWNVDDFIAIAKKVKASGYADAIGCQAHELFKSTGQYSYPEMTAIELATVLKKLHDQVGLPIFITELDLSYDNDTEQLNAYKALFPIMWESPYVAGITLWGYIYGQTWSQAQYSGLIRNGTERPALTWLKDYISTHKNVTNPLPLPGTTISVYGPAPRAAASSQGATAVVSKDVDRVDFRPAGAVRPSDVLGRQ